MKILKPRLKSYSTLIVILISIHSWAAENLHTQATKFFAPLPKSMPGSENDSPEKVALGKALFFETALSINNNQSCNSCHDVSGNGPGVDNETTSLGATKIRGDRNSPSVWNAGFHIAQFWDGRSLDLIDQAKKPILNPVEMALPDESTVVKRLIDEGYKPLFQIVFPDNEEPLSFHTVAQAIAAFERTLITNDRFDDYLTGNLSALDEQEKEGLSAFINEGCFGCHNGALLGGSSFQKMGLANPYPNTLDLGRFSITKLEAHKYVFKVPSLRDVSRTGPYFHDGSAKTLEQAISDMAWYQLNKKLPEETIKNISAFLQSLEHYHNTESK